MESSSRPFSIFKESSVKRNLTRSAYLSSPVQKFPFPIDAVLNFVQTLKGLELAIRSQFLQNF